VNREPLHAEQPQRRRDQAKSAIAGAVRTANACRRPEKSFPPHTNRLGSALFLSRQPDSNHRSTHSFARFWYPSFAITFRARRWIDSAARLYRLNHDEDSGAIARRTLFFLGGSLQPKSFAAPGRCLRRNLDEVQGQNRSKSLALILSTAF
jgi:hypothetical protein